MIINIIRDGSGYHATVAIDYLSPTDDDYTWQVGCGDTQANAIADLESILASD